MSEQSASPHAYDGNWYVLIAGLPRPAVALTLAPGVSLCPSNSPSPSSTWRLPDLSVFEVGLFSNLWQDGACAR